MPASLCIAAMNAALSIHLLPDRRPRRHLARRVAMTGTGADDVHLPRRLAVISSLQAALGAEAARGKAGSCLYDLGRHLKIRSALAAEYEALILFLADLPR